MEPPDRTRTLVVLGASSDQLFLIRTAREMGLRVLACDRNPDSPGFHEADEHAVVSTRDVDALRRLLDERRAEGVELAGVTTMGSDIPDVVQVLSAHLGTPSVTAASAALATDKLAMKDRFLARGIPIPWYAEVYSAAEVREAVRRRGRLVLKPIDRSGSRGVFLVDEESDVARLFAAARGTSLSGRAMIEEYLEGPQISTETVMVDGRGITPGFADRNYEHLERFRPQVMENGAWVPSRLSAGERERVEDLVVSASLALGVETGVTKGDVVLTSTGPKVIEIAARLSGGHFCECLVPLGTGVNYVRVAIQLAIGDDPDLESLAPRFDRAVANRYFFPEPGVLTSVEGLEEVRAQDWIERLELWYEPGDALPVIDSHAQRAGVFVATAPDLETLEERVAWVYRTVRLRTSKRAA